MIALNTIVTAGQLEKAFTERYNALSEEFKGISPTAGDSGNRKFGYVVHFRDTDILEEALAMIWTEEEVSMFYELFEVSEGYDCFGIRTDLGYDTFYAHGAIDTVSELIAKDAYDYMVTSTGDAADCWTTVEANKLLEEDYFAQLAVLDKLLELGNEGFNEAIMNSELAQAEMEEEEEEEYEYEE